MHKAHNDTTRPFDPCVLKYLMSVTPRPVVYDELAQGAWKLYAAQFDGYLTPSNAPDYVESRFHALYKSGVIRIHPLIDEKGREVDGFANRFVFEPRFLFAGVQNVR